MVFSLPAIENRGYEKRDINVFKVIGAAIVIIVILITLVIVLRDFFAVEKEKIVYEQTLKPGSALLQELQANENETLSSYKLLDSTRGIYQIPIDRVMELLVQEAGGKPRRTQIHTINICIDPQEKPALAC